MKKVLITGCSSGFGFEASKHLADKGNHIIATMRNVEGKNSKPAQDLKAYANANNVKIDVVEMDVVSDESVERAMSQISDVDVLINNAGIGFGGAIEAFSSEQCLAQLDLNIVGTVRTTKAVLPQMRAKNSGLIIQVSSIAGRGAFPGFGIYHASKWGLEGLSEALRYELAPLGIDVVLVEPGPFSTNFFGNVVPAEDEEVAAAYSHVGEFLQGFETNVKTMFEDANAPTEPKVIVEIFENLINTPAGSRPLRTIGGLDFGFQTLNDAVEPIRKQSVEGMGLLDGPSK